MGKLPLIIPDTIGVMLIIRYSGSQFIKALFIYCWKK